MYDSYYRSASLDVDQVLTTDSISCFRGAARRPISCICSSMKTNPFPNNPLGPLLIIFSSQQLDPTRIWWLIWIHRAIYTLSKKRSPADWACDILWQPLIDALNMKRMITPWQLMEFLIQLVIAETNGTLSVCMCGYIFFIKRNGWKILPAWFAKTGIKVCRWEKLPGEDVRPHLRLDVCTVVSPEVDHAKQQQY